MRCRSPDGWAGLLQTVEPWSHSAFQDNRGRWERPPGQQILITGPKQGPWWLGSLSQDRGLGELCRLNHAAQGKLYCSHLRTPGECVSASISRWSQMFLVLCLITMSHASPCYPWEAHSPEGRRLDHKGRRLSHILVLWAPRALCTSLYFSCCYWVWAVIFLQDCDFFLNECMLIRKGRRFRYSLMSIV